MAAAIAFLTALAVAVEDVRGDFAPFVPTEPACSMGKISLREENRASNSTSKAESSHNSLTNARNHFSAPAHCDSQMTDNGQLVVPEGSDVGVIWSDTDPVGSPFMIGCVSNRFTAVCRYVVVCRLSVIMFLPFNVKIDFLAIKFLWQVFEFLAVPCLALPCLAMPCRAMPCLALPAPRLDTPSTYYYCDLALTPRQP